MTSPDGLQVLEGTLERLTYQNEENGCTVARLIPTGKSYEVTIVGSLADADAGESLRLHGTWATSSATFSTWR